MRLQVLIGKTWKEPKTPYAAKYPYNKILETEPKEKPSNDPNTRQPKKPKPPNANGHIIELDDTPGAERVYIHHKAGTFIEIHPDGTVVSKNKTDNYLIVLKDNYVHVKGIVNVAVDGDTNMKVGGNCNLEVSGDMKHKVNGNYTLSVSGAYKCTSGSSITMNAGSNMKLKGSRIDLN